MFPIPVHYRPLAAALGLLAAGCMTAPAVADTESDPNARDLKIIANWFAGEFDNEEQLWFEKDPRSNTPEEDVHQRVHTVHIPIDAPALGDHVFYVEEYSDNDPDEVFRQRIVIFSSDLERGEIRMQQGFPSDSAALRGAREGAEALANITPDQVTFLNECDVFWRRVADQFEGAMDPKACVFGEGEARRYSVHNMTLSASKYWREDYTQLVADDSFYTGTKPGHPTRMRRAETYLCEGALIHDGERQAFADQTLHDQGGTLELVREADGKSFTVMMRQKEYPYYEDRPDFMFFSVRETGEFRSLAYSVNDRYSRRVGIATSAFNIHCHREGYDFLETIEDLNETY